MKPATPSEVARGAIADRETTKSGLIARGIRHAERFAVAPRDLVERTRLFALGILKFCRQLPTTREAQEAGSQLRRAANSTRSNYRAARKGRSRAEFQSKLQTAFEEADECVDWLEYLRDGDIRANAALLQEARELASILGKAVQTARKNTARLKDLSHG